MQLFMAYNSALSTTTGIAAGTSYVAATARVALQLQVPSNGYIDVVEWGISFDGSAAVTPALVELATTTTGSTVTTAHSTATVRPLGDSDLAATRLTMATTGTGFGNGAITSNATLRMLDRQYVAPTSQYVKIWPEGRFPVVGGATSTFLQFRINTTATVDAIVYAVWNERI